MQRVTAQAEAKKVQLIQNNRHHGDNVFIDPVQISAALGNLLKNAIEVSLPQSSVEVRLTDGDEGFVSVEVLDQALPLLPQEIEKVFKPFYSQKKEGLGLGLSLSQALVEHNGGVLRYNAQPEKSFQILLPTRES
jgi:signal transduction histidine kinase